MNEFKKVSFYTLGCKLNFSETSTLARQFENAGYAKVKFDELPDVFVINTCSVTQNADKECRQIVNRAMRVNPNATVAIIGCYAQLKPNEIATIPGVDVVLGAKEKFDVVNYITQNSKKKSASIFNSEIKSVKSFIASWSENDRTRTFLKVQDGCDYFCAFCTIPLARGFSRSNTVSETLEVAKKISNKAIKEIVLTGVNIGDFGKHHNEQFITLIKQLDELNGIDRFRISSIEPNLLSNEIIEFVAQSKKFVPHFHVPLQSGNDRLLHLMRRRYNKALYASRIEKIKSFMPNACIGVDVISGFPTESENDFNETFKFLNELPVSYLHAFTYSERQNTTAVRLQEIVPNEIRLERTKKLNILSEKKRRAFYESQLSSTCKVLFETENNNGYLSGYSENYIRVQIPYENHFVNSIQDVKLQIINNEGNVNGELINLTQFSN